MKLFAALFCAALAAAAPVTDVEVEKDILRRQVSGGSTANELEKGGCKGSTFIWARGTMEPGNMGFIIGNYLSPILQKGLNRDIAIQGVKYDAGILTNVGPGMADPSGVKEAQRLFTLATTKCPNTIITGGGYSQGAAIMHRAIEKLPEDVKGKITAILMYGDTQYASDGQSIKGFPKDKVKVICKSDDGVCVGYITVTAGHLSYSSKADEGAQWLVQKIKAAQGGSGGSSASSASSAGRISKIGKGGKGKGGKASEASEVSEKVVVAVEEAPAAVVMTAAQEIAVSA